MSIAEIILEALLNLSFSGSDKEPKTVINDEVTLNDVLRHILNDQPYSRLYTLQKWLFVLPLLLSFVIIPISVSLGWNAWIPPLILITICWSALFIIDHKIKKHARSLFDGMTPELRKQILEEKLREAYNQLPITILEDDQTVVELQQKLQDTAESGRPAGTRLGRALENTKGIAGIVAAEMARIRNNPFTEISYLIHLPGRYTPGEKLKLICFVNGDYTILYASAYDDENILVTLYKKSIDFLQGRKFYMIITRVS